MQIGTEIFGGLFMWNWQIVGPLWESALLSDTQKSLLGGLYTGWIVIHLDAIGRLVSHLKVSLFAYTHVEYTWMQ